MKRIFIIAFVSLVIVFSLVSCVSNEQVEEEVGFASAAIAEYSLGTPIPIMLNGIEIGTVTVFNSSIGMAIKYELEANTRNSLAEITQIILEESGIEYDYHKTAYSGKSYTYIPRKEFKSGLIFDIHLWIESGCGFEDTSLYFTISESGGGNPEIIVTAIPYSVEKNNYDWELEKTSDQEELDCLEIEQGEMGQIVYKIAVTKGEPQTTKKTLLDGSVDVYSNNPGLEISSIELFLLKDGNILDTLLVTLPSNPVLNAGETVSYPYEWNLTDIITDFGVNYVVKAVVNFNNSNQLEAGTGTFDFNNLLLIEEKAYLNDIVEEVDNEDFKVDFPDFPEFPITLTDATTLHYTAFITAPDECGQIGHLVNIATLKEGSPDIEPQHEVILTNCFHTPECEELGCVLTLGYWKTHFPDSWPSVPSNYPPELEVLHLSIDYSQFYKALNKKSQSQSWIDVLNTPTKKGNAYYILAHQFIPAILNILNGASIPQKIAEAIKQSNEWFEKYSPDDNYSDGDTYLAKEILTPLLDTYNNGLNFPKTGWPPHCDD